MILKKHFFYIVVFINCFIMTTCECVNTALIKESENEKLRLDIIKLQFEVNDLKKNIKMKHDLILSYQSELCSLYESLSGNNSPASPTSSSSNDSLREMR